MSTATIEHTMTDEDFQDVCCAASYGGIDYWVKDCIFKPADEKNTFSRFIILTEDDEKIVITKDKVEQAMVDLWTDKIGVNDGIKNSIRWAIYEQEYGEIDSTAADCIIQATAFQEIIYG